MIGGTGRSSHIAHVVNLSTLVGHPSPRRELSLQGKIEAVAAAGFDGISAALTPEHRRWSERAGLKHTLGAISAADPRTFGPLLRAQKDAGAVLVNVQFGDHDTPPATAARHWLRLVGEAEKIGGLTVSLETHRDCCTETPEKTYAIARRFHRSTGQPIRLTLDFSHFAVVKHLRPPDYAERLLDHPDLVRNAVMCHFRPFNGHHCQVPVMHRGKLTPETQSYLTFAEALMRMWRSGPENKGKTLFACPEILPFRPEGAGYNITGFPPAWPSACSLRAELDKAWSRAAQ